MLMNIFKGPFLRSLFATQTTAVEAPKKYAELISKARPLMKLYNLHPNSIGRLFISPTSTLVGEIYLGNLIAIGHGTVLRGDISPI
jgi:hypothetical protein